ncbi:hypothetical protein ARMSODRAFT_978756 [Armillaria solidipes]|uniref:Uncharacterized protein n=1 Tax=Armillaria solidipes TaxID=1076256 RepID=A0A2H3BFG8_9AGAR|nr:hypothetical protein ARMSODRAFT_978756 [Armillaria solidipes]
MGHEVDEDLILLTNTKHRGKVSAKLTDENNDAKDARNIKNRLAAGTMADAVEDRADIPKDNDKPNGDAVNPDGTLKTVDQMSWDYSPTASPVKLVSANTATMKRRHEDLKESQPSTSKNQKTITHKKLGLETKQMDVHEEQMIWTRIWRWTKGNRGTGRPKARAVIKDGVPEKGAFMMGNVTTRCRHITHMKNHYESYIELCEKHSITGKAQVPEGWGQNEPRKQSSILNFTVVKVPPPPFTKAGLAEYLTEFIVDLSTLQSFWVADWPSLHWVLTYLHLKMVASEIPQWTMISDNITHKTETVDQIDIATIKTGEAVGKELLHVVDKYDWHDCMGWFVGDNVTVNDVAIHYICITVDPSGEVYDPVERRGRCIKHAIHLMGGHFIIALQIPALMKTKCRIHQRAPDEIEPRLEDLHPNFTSLDVDVSMDVEAVPQDAAAKVDAGITDFEPGDVVGKILVLIAQVHSGGSEQAREYLLRLCDTCYRYVLHPCRQEKLDDDEWEIISLAHQALAIPANAHSELSAEKIPTCQRVYPVIEQLQFQWEELIANPKFDPVLPALEPPHSGCASIFLVLDPGCKLTYLSIVWEDAWIKRLMTRMSKIFLKYKAKITTPAKHDNTPVIQELKRQALTTTDDWIDELIHKRTASVLSMPESPTAELEEFIYSKPVQRALCEDIIAWWGVQVRGLEELEVNLEVWVRGSGKCVWTWPKLDPGQTICTRVPPQCIWDLCSNQVVPWWVARPWLWGISHAWMDEVDCKDILTPINGREWPVPISKDTSLDLIRIEMLNLGAEQKGGIREDLREEEWKVDVPTIRSVYDKTNLNKVEISMNPIIGGDTGDEALRVKFKEKLSFLQDIRDEHVYDVLSEMQKQVSTYLINKIVGMTYIMGSMSIPAYYGKQSEDDAWIALMDVVASCGQQSWHLADLLFLHPEPGTKGVLECRPGTLDREGGSNVGHEKIYMIPQIFNLFLYKLITPLPGIKSWWPSWKQIMTKKLPPKLCSSDTRSNWTSQLLICNVRTDTFNHGYIIESALVQGLSDGDSQEQERYGKFVVKDNAGTVHTFKIVAYHQCSIPDSSYTLLGTESWDSGVLHCVVGWRLPDQRFKKLLVFKMYDEDIVSFLSRGIATNVHTTYFS